MKISSLFCHCLLAGIACGAALQAQTNPNQLQNLHGIPASQRTVLPLAFTWPVTPGGAALCLWKDDKTAALSYTIDDNNVGDIGWWMNEAAQRDLKLTWFLVASGISVNNPSMNGTWEQWRTVRNAGHALESHTMTHLAGSKDPATWLGLHWEYEASKIRIQDNIGNGHKVTTLAYPGGAYPASNDPAVAALYYAAARGTVGTLNSAQNINYLGVNAMSRANFGTNPTNAFSNADNMLVLNNSYKQGYRGWSVIIYHSINQSDPAVVARTRAELDYAVTHRNEIWTGRFNDIARYGQSRETATLTVTSNTFNRIVFQLTDRMNDAVFDYPLTVKVRLPDHWSTAVATQNGNSAPVQLVEYNGATYALVDAVPDRGETVLVPGGNMLLATDVGNPVIGGSTTVSSGPSGDIHTLKAAGSDIWGTSDQFQFAYRQLTGDGEIIARVNSVTAINMYSKGGIMMRESLAANSKNVALIARSGSNRFHYRTQMGGETVAVGTGPGVPQWLKITRAGNAFNGYRSADGISWTWVGSVQATMGQTLQVGLAATSREVTASTSAVFDHFQINAAP